MRAILTIGLLLSSSAASAADEKPTIQNDFLRVTAEGPGGAFSIQALPSQKPVITSAKLASAAGNPQRRAISDRTFGAGEAIEWSSGKILLFPKLPFALLRGTVKNDDSEMKVVNEVPLASFQVHLDQPATSLKTMGTGGLLAPEKNPGSYTWLAVAEPKSRHAVVAGWLTHDRASGLLFPKIENDVVSIQARSDYGNLRLAPSATAETETLAVGYFDDGRLSLEAWADAVAKVYKIKLPPQPAGYCTWYAEAPFNGAANEQYIATLTDFVTKQLVPFGFTFIQIDDKWQEGASQRNGPNKNFTTHRTSGPYPGGMKKTADYIKQHGLTPGIWFMPFAGTHNDPWFAEHQDWFVKNSDGKPFDVAWGGTSLDMTNPKVQQYVRDIVHRIAKDWGYTYFKLDGLYTGMAVEPRYVNAGYKIDEDGKAADKFGNAVFADPNKTNVEVYRDGLKLVREAAGPNVFILGCNTAQNMRTLGASFGLMEAMRIGPDNSGNWQRWAARSPKSGSQMYFLNGRIWYNDPDPNFVRTSIELEDARTIASWSAICGQLNSNSDWIPNLPPERLELLKRTILPHGKTARPVDYFENDPPRIWIVTDDKGPTRRDVVALFNWSESEMEFDVPVERLGLPEAKEYAVFDYWADKSSPPIQSRLTAKLPKHGCQILAVLPMLDRPLVISTSRHVTQGMVDVLEEKWDATTKTLSGKSRVVGGDPYELRIVIPRSLEASSQVRANLSEADNAAGAKLSTDPSSPGRATITSPQSREVQWSVRFNRP